jgi:hypothetical protein
VEQSGEDLVLRRWRGNLIGGGFLLLWLIGWTVGCVALVQKVIGKPDLENILLACPFLPSWVFVFVLMARLLFSFESLRLGPGGLEYHWSALVLRGERHVPLEAVKRVVDDHAALAFGSSHYEYGLKIHTKGEPIYFAFGVAPMERLWLAELIRKHLQSLKSTWAMPAPGHAVKRTTAGYSRSGDAWVEVLQPHPHTPEMPADSAIRMYRDWDHIGFVRQSSVSWGLFGLVTFCHLFWNGIVGIFLMQLAGQFQWSTFFFLIPFVVIGLAIFGIWLAVLSVPFWREHWAFRSEEMRGRFSVLGFGRSRRCELRSLDRIELRYGAVARKALVPLVDKDEEGTRPFSLGFVSPESQDLLVMDGLTEGEARWIAAEVFRDYPEWFAKRK